MEPAEYEVRWMQKVQQQSASPTYFERGRLVPVIGSASGGGGLGWSRELCSDGFITVGVDPTSINDFQSATLLNMHLAPAELWLMRNGVLVQRGPIIAYQVEGQSLIIFARGMLYYLRYMWVFEFDDYIGIDQALIVKGLIDNHQAEDYGNFGLDTSGITSHGVTRTRKYRPREFINLASEIRAMGQADNGYDIDYDLAADEVKLWYPEKGVDRSQQNGVVDGVILDARGITNPNFADVVTAGKFGSSAIVVGFDKEGGAYPYLAHNATTRAGFGLSFVSGQIDGVSGYAEVSNYAFSLRDQSSYDFVTPSKEFIQVEGAGVDDFDPGDTVTFVFDPGFLPAVGTKEITKDLVVKNINVAVHPEGQEKLSVGFI